MVRVVKVKSIILVVLGLIIIPFLFIPFVAFILKIGFLLSSFLPSKLIVLEINMSETVTLSTFIYYYSCFLSIEVTGILSYLLFKLTKDKYLNDEKEKEQLEKKEFIKILNELLIELESNYKAYTRERSNTNWSFYQKFEIEKYSQFGYGPAGKEFKIQKRDIHLPSFFFIERELNNSSIKKELESIYNIFEVLSKHEDKYQMKDIDFTGFADRVKKLIKELRNIIHYLSL